MNSTSVFVIVEGQTEQTFIRDVLAPELWRKEIFLTPILIGKPGHKGGNVRFARAVEDISRFLKQRADTYVTTIFDYFRIGTDWPGLNTVQPNLCAVEKAAVIEKATLDALAVELPTLNVSTRFIPYLSMHEFEALLFSEKQTLADGLGVPEASIASILSDCGEPEEINEGPHTAPSKRILSLNPEYRKVAMGKSIAEQIGISRMRTQCPHFDQWLSALEKLK